MFFCSSLALSKSLLRTYFTRTERVASISERKLFVSFIWVVVASHVTKDGNVYLFVWPLNRLISINIVLLYNCITHSRKFKVYLYIHLSYVTSLMNFIHKTRKIRSTLEKQQHHIHLRNLHIRSQKNTSRSPCLKLIK